MNIEKILREEQDRENELAERLEATAGTFYQDMPTEADERALTLRANQLMSAARECGLIQVELAKAAGQLNALREVVRDEPLAKVG